MTTKAAPKVVNHRHLSFGQRVIRDWKLNKWKYLLIIPVLVYLALFCYKPMYGLVIAFKNYKPTRGVERSGWMDPWYTWFTTFFNDPYFGRLIGNTFTTDESDRLDLLGGNSNLNTYVAENYAAFINGSKDINDDATWEAYLAGFDSLNLTKLLEIRQGALDRYEAR